MTKRAQEPSGVSGVTDGRRVSAERGRPSDGVDTVRLLLQAAGSASRSVNAVLAQFGVTAAHAGLLWALVPAPADAEVGTDAPTLREIATRLGCDPSTVSLSADRLQELGLVARGRHPVDGRKRILVLTEDGGRLWDAVTVALGGAGLFASFSDSERRELERLLAKIPAAG